MELKKIKRHHLVITLVCAIAVAIIGVGSKLIELGDQALSIATKIQASSATPSLIQFALSDSAHGYKESMEFIFGAGPTSIRTFQQIHPLHSPPVLVFQFTLHNPSSRDLHVKSITYKITETGQIMASTPGPIESNKKYKHNIGWAVGDQFERLSDVYKIPPNTTGAFEVEITTNPETPAGAGVVMTALIETDMGNIETDRFQMFLPVSKGSSPSGSKPIQDTSRNPIEPKIETPPNKTTDNTSGLDNNQPTTKKPTESEGIRLPPVDVIDSILSSSNISRYCDEENFDRLDRDMLFMRTTTMSFEDYLHASPSNSDKRYAEIFPENELRYFWTYARKHFESWERN